MTKFPNLVDLQGPAKINQTDIAEIMDYTGTRMPCIESPVLQPPQQLCMLASVQ